MFVYSTEALFWSSTLHSHIVYFKEVKWRGKAKGFQALSNKPTTPVWGFVYLLIISFGCKLIIIFVTSKIYRYIYINKKGHKWWSVEEETPQINSHSKHSFIFFFTVARTDHIWSVWTLMYKEKVSMCFVIGLNSYQIWSVWYNTSHHHLLSQELHNLHARAPDLSIYRSKEEQGPKKKKEVTWHS